MISFSVLCDLRAMILTVGYALAVVVAGCSPTQAETIVALGASQTYGHGVERGQDYPTLLAQMLVAKGVKVTVKNAGARDGETTEQMLARLETALGPDTRLVIFQPGRERDGDDRKDNVSEIKKKLAQRGIAILKIPNSWFKEFPRQTDGQHLTPEGYRGLAAKLVPQVIAALKR